MANRVWIVKSRMLKVIEEAERTEMKRDQPIQWEKIHMAGCACIGYRLAEERGVDPVLAAAACAVHDIGRVLTGVHAGHAEAGGPRIEEFLFALNRDYAGRDEALRAGGESLFTRKEIGRIRSATEQHSKKGEIGKPLEEIVKDADVLDMHYCGMPFPREEQRQRLERLMAAGVTMPAADPDDLK